VRVRTIRWKLSVVAGSFNRRRSAHAWPSLCARRPGSARSGNRSDRHQQVRLVAATAHRSSTSKTRRSARMRWRGYNIRRTRRPFPRSYYADPRLARINLLARRSAKESVPDVSAGSHVIRRVRHDSLVETRPSDLISGSDPSPVLGGSGTPTGQRKLTGRPAGKGTILTRSL
jgi:hypothetical protein